MTVPIVVAIFTLFASSCFAENPICSGVPSGNIFLFPYPGDCTRFYRCEDGEATVQRCDDGKWFNEAIQSCDAPESSGCTNIYCLPGVVDYYPNRADCSLFIECHLGNLYFLECPDGLWFNAVQKRCVQPEDSDCGAYTNEPTWATPDPVCYGVRPGRIELKPYPGDCNKYIKCEGDTPSVWNCPPYLYFDKDRQMCDQKDISGCDDTTGTPPDHTTVTPPPGPITDPRCADGAHTYWPDVECNTFIECLGGVGYELECPSGLYFDEDTKMCLDPDLVSCGRTDPPVPTRSTNPDWTPDPRCHYPSPDRYLFPYPGDCTKFLECITGEVVVMNCPPGLFFNPHLLVCDYPYEADCHYLI